MFKSFLKALFLIGAVAAIAPATSPARAETVIIRIQDYPGPGNILFRIAAEKGICEKYQIKCALQMIPSGPLGAQALLAKSIDVGFFPTEVQIGAALKGAKMKAIAGASVRNVFLLATRAGLDTPRLKEGYPAFMAGLKGKKIGVPARGSAAEMQFQFMAERAGMSPDDFTFVAVGGPNTSQGALRSRQIDATMSFEPSGAICEVTKVCDVIYRGATAALPKEIAATNGASSNLVVLQEMIDTRKDVVDRLIKAEQDAFAFFLDPANTDEIQSISAKFFKLDLPQGDEIMALVLAGRNRYSPSLKRSALQAAADYMLLTKQISEPFDAKSLAYEGAPQ